MKYLLVLVLTTVVFFGCCEKSRVKVACVGDSITEGFGIAWQSQNSYPAQLATQLGDGYEVMNFGRSATTMMQKGDFPYWLAKEFSNAVAYRPDVVVIKLGTNDSKLFQWNAEQYAASYQAMIDTFLTLEPMPTIKLCLPVPAFETRWEITDSVVVGGVIPVIREIAQRNNLEIIDLYEALKNCGEYFEDGIHPNREGAALVAVEVAKFIK